MNKLLQRLDRLVRTVQVHFTPIVSLLVFFGVLTDSFFLISVCYLLIFLWGFVKFSAFPLGLSLRKDIKKHFSSFAKDLNYVLPVLVFLTMLVSGIYSANQAVFLQKLKIGLPFLMLPIGFFSLPKLSKVQFFWFLRGFFWMTFASAGYSFWVNWQVASATIDLLHYGKSMFAPINHIRYSLVVALAILVGGYLATRGSLVVRKTERWVIGFGAVILFAFLHFFSVRSGLAGIYGALVAGALAYSFSRRYAVWGVILLLLFAPLAAYYLLPSFQAKVRYVQYDWEHYRKGVVYTFSDGQRIVSWKLGLAVGNKSSLIGVGYGDVYDEMSKLYAERYRDLEKRISPHNEFIYRYAATGVVGLAVFLVAFFYPWWSNKRFFDPLFSAFHVLVFISFLPEETLGTVIGNCFYLYVMLLLLKFLESNPPLLE